MCKGALAIADLQPNDVIRKACQIAGSSGPVNDEDMAYLREAVANLEVHPLPKIGDWVRAKLESILLVFYEQGQFPQNWEASPVGRRSDDIQSLKSALLKSPLFGTGPYLGPRSYRDGGLQQVGFHKEVRGESVFFWHKDAKKEGVVEPDNIIIRGTQFVVGKWVVYYSMPDCPTPLYGILYDLFQQRVMIHPPEPTSLKRYSLVIGGPRLASDAEQRFPPSQKH